MNSIEKRISNTSKHISLLLKIGSYVLLMVTALAIIGLGVLSFANTETKASFLAAFHTTASNGMILEIIPRHLYIMLASMALYSVCLYMVIYNTYLIFKNVSEECTPFHHKHIVRIKRIACMVIGLSIIGSFSDGLFDLFTINELVWRIDFNGIILGIIIYCLAFFFDYGCELQKQSDETL